MKIAIVDDAEQWRDIIKKAVQKNVDSETQIELFSSGKKLLDKNEPYDVVFFDVELSDDEENGLEYCRAYKNLYPQQDYFAIIVTSHIELSRKGYMSSAFRYIDKDNIHEEMKETFAAIERVYMLKTCITVTPKRNAAINVVVNDIWAIETQGRNVLIITKNGEYFVNENIASIMDMVDQYGFYMIHKGIIINMRYVDRIEKDYLTLTGTNRRFEISRRKHSDFLAQLVEWKVRAV